VQDLGRHVRQGGAGAGAKAAMAKKADECHRDGRIPDEQCFQPLGFELGFESEGYACKEVNQVLHAWSKLWMERRDKTKGEADKLLFGWRCRLAFIGTHAPAR
jgi:hypothetical protein